MENVVLTDDQISSLILERKPIPAGLCPNVKMTQRQGHYRREFEVKGDSGHTFQIRVRRAVLDPLDFSVILGYYLPGSYTVFRLCRYNGRHHHSNKVEREAPFLDFHIHLATERYQRAVGMKADAYAEPTRRYWDLESAIGCFLAECGFAGSVEDGPLFSETL
jgi:hypothetical protein